METAERKIEAIQKVLKLAVRLHDQNWKELQLLTEEQDLERMHKQKVMNDILVQAINAIQEIIERKEENA